MWIAKTLPFNPKLIGKTKFVEPMNFRVLLAKWNQRPVLEQQTIQCRGGRKSDTLIYSLNHATPPDSLTIYATLVLLVTANNDTLNKATLCNVSSKPKNNPIYFFRIFINLLRKGDNSMVQRWLQVGQLPNVDIKKFPIS